MKTETPSRAAILKPDTLPAHDRGGGASTVPLVGPALGSERFMTGHTILEPGAEIPFHRHNCEESVVLLEGEAVLDIDGEEFRLEAQDVTFIPANVDHRFRNPSKTDPMKILWIYGDVAATRTLTETGETRPVSGEHGGAQGTRK